jgi:hypothetical protein
MPFMLFNHSKERRNLESKARRTASAAGFSIVKSKVRPGGYRLIDRQRNIVIAGDQFDLSAEDVLRLIASLEPI